MAAAQTLKAADPEAIRKAAEIIRNGGLVAFPTETVYGLGADACNPTAVARVFEVKARPSLDPMIVHVSSAEDASRYCEIPAGAARELMKRFWPGPLTLVLPRKETVPPIVTAGLDTVAIRVPSHPVALALILMSERAIAAPSANLFGYVSPTEAGHVAAQLADRIDMILDGGACPVGVESTVLSLLEPRPRILRAGGVTAEELEDAIGPVERPMEEVERPISPGQLTRHYATRVRLEILAEGDPRADPRPGERVGLIALLPPRPSHGFASVETLSSSADLREAAANLFAALRRLDCLGLDRIVAYPVPEAGLGLAIMDRLRRCSAPAEESDGR